MSVSGSPPDWCHQEAASNMTQAASLTHSIHISRECGRKHIAVRLLIC